MGGRKDPEQRRAYQKAYREARKEELSAYSRTYHADYYAANKERVLAACRLYQKQNQEVIRARKRTYREEHAKEIAAQLKANYEAHREERKAYRLANADRKKAYMRAYRILHAEALQAYEKAHRAEHLARWHKRHALQMGNGHTPYKVSDIIERDRGICGLCHKKVAEKDRSMDHILPLSLGGADAPHNVQLAHRRCNYAKQNLACTPQNLRLALE